jgi:hypothetical protein
VWNEERYQAGMVIFYFAKAAHQKKKNKKNMNVPKLPIIYLSLTLQE